MENPSCALKPSGHVQEADRDRTSVKYDWEWKKDMLNPQTNINKLLVFPHKKLEGSIKWPSMPDVHVTEHCACPQGGA